MPPYSRHIFLNVPFDPRYQKLFRALVFAVHDCGFTARCALEQSDSGQVRLDKLYQLIEACQFGVHDLSRTSLDSVNRLPRFNMPLELGIFLGAKRFGTPRHRQKHTLVLDTLPYRYQKFCSDIAGQDVRPHGNTVGGAIRALRDWLRETFPTLHLPGEVRIENRYLQFLRALPLMCVANGLRVGTVRFVDYRALAVGWQAENDAASRPAFA